MTIGWRVLKIGGGGFISGAAFHSDGTKAIRADSGGGYRWNASTSVWERFLRLSNMPAPDASPSVPDFQLNGVYEVQIAPSNSSRWYMTYIGYVFRSDDKGTTWTNITRGVTGAPPQLTGWFSIANDSFRGNGPKMAIDPTNADVVIVGTPANGLWYTLNAGSTWTKISTVTDSTTGGFLICYDPSASGSIYAASYGQGVFHTSTGPSGTWSSTTATGMPTTGSGMAIAANGTLFVVPNNASHFLYRLAGGASGTWSQVSVDAGDNICGVAVNPANSNQVWVSGTVSKLSYSADNGATFSGYGTMSYSSPLVQWNATLASAGQNPGFGSLFYDPATSLLYLGHGSGIAYTTPPTSATAITWNDVSQGVEEIISTKVLKPPGGSPIAAGWDMGVFRSISPDSYPATKGINNNPAGISACWNLDYCPNSPLVIACRVQFFGVETSGKSTDGGVTWSLFTGAADYAADGNIGGDIACGTDPLNLVLVKTDSGTNNNRPFYTLDGGATWTAITMTGVSATGPTGWNANYNFRSRILVADHSAADTFYMYNQGATSSTAGIYQSTNKGVSWSRVFTGSFAAGSSSVNKRLYSVPNNAGHLFFTSGQTGDASNPAPQHSVDGGITWNALTTCGEVWAIGFGKPSPSGSGYPTIFIIGFVSSVFGVYRSDDTAATWNQVGTDFACPQGNFDNMVDITGDPDVYGNAYMAQFETGFSFFQFADTASNVTAFSVTHGHAKGHTKMIAY